MAIPVSDQRLWSAAADGSGFVVAHRESATEPKDHTYTVIKFDAPMDTVFAVDFSYKLIPIADAWLSREIEEQVRVHEGGSTIADFRRFRRAVREAFSRLDHYPAVDWLKTGADGTTWVKLRTGEISFERTVLDEEGRIVRRFMAPPRSRLAVGDLQSAWFVEQDRLDIPYLVRYRIRQPQSRPME